MFSSSLFFSNVLFFLDLIYARRLPYAVFFLDPLSLLFLFIYIF